jgi:predicted tellurium resistance membrane protein TerC
MWEEIIPMVVGAILSFAASFIDRLPSNMKSVVISAVAFLVAVGFWFAVPELQELNFQEILGWAFRAIGSATASYAFIWKPSKKAVGGKAKKK